MKKIINKTLLGVIATIVTISIILVSCEKGESEVSNLNKVKSNVSTTTKILEGITYGDICSATQKHNQYIEEFAQIIDLQDDNYQEEIIKCISKASMDNASIEIRQQILTELESRNFIPISDFEYINNLNNYSDIIKKDRVIQLISIIEPYDFENLDFDMFSNKVDSIQNMAFDDLCNYDLLAVLAYTEQLRASFYCWMPKELGGSGIGYNLFERGFSSVSKAKTDDVDPWVKAVGEAALADGKSFSMSCLIIAFTGGTGLGPAAIAAALTSAEAGISTYIKEKKETDKD